MRLLLPTESVSSDFLASEAGVVLKDFTLLVDDNRIFALVSDTGNIQEAASAIINLAVPTNVIPVRLRRAPGWRTGRVSGVLAVAGRQRGGRAATAEERR